MIEQDDDTRDRGILTKADRKYLRGERDLTKGSASNRRMKIRNRVMNALADFELLTHNLAPGDRKQLFEIDPDSIREEHASEGVTVKKEERGIGFLENIVMFVYMVCRDWGLDFEALIERAVRKAETSIWLKGQFNQRDDVHTVQVTVDLKQNPDIDIENAMKRFESGEELTLEEIGALVRENMVDDEDLAELVRVDLPQMKEEDLLK
jgi:hypothetical protein